MSLQTFVKISNVTNLSDARYCAGMGVDIIGFNIDPTATDHVSPEDFKEITEWVAGVSFAGEFTNASIEQIKDTIKEYPIDYLEVSNINLVEQAGLLGKPMIVKITVNNESELNELTSTLSYLDELVKKVIIKCSNNGLTEKLNEFLAFYNGNLKLIKGFDVTASEGIAKFSGLEMEATAEEKPGFKDYGDVMDVLEFIEEV